MNKLEDEAFIYTKFELDLKSMAKTENGRVDNAQLVADEEHLIEKLTGIGYDCILEDTLSGVNYNGVHRLIAIGTKFDGSKEQIVDENGNPRGPMGDFLGLSVHTNLLYMIRGQRIDNTGRIKKEGLAYFND